nr:MAG TPA: hypothetical protein [Caudoviricetes sp.]
MPEILFIDLLKLSKKEGVRIGGERPLVGVSSKNRKPL